MIRRVTKVALTVVVTVGLLALVVALVGFDDTVEAVGQAGPWAFLSTGALLAGVLAIQAVAWGVLNKPIAHRMPFRMLMGATAVGMAGNIITPSTYLGGEPVKVIYAGRKTGLPYQELAGTVLLAKYLEALSFVLFLAAGTLVAAVGLRDVLFAGGNLPLGIAAVGVVVAAMVMLVLLWVSLWRHWAPLTRMLSVLARLRVGRRFFTRLRRRCLRMERQVSRTFCQEHGAIWPAFGLYVLTHLAMFVKPLAFFVLGWRLGLSFAELGLIFLTCQVLLAFQLTPSGVGTLDGGLLGVLAVAGIGITRPQCTAFLLCVRFWDAALLGVGALLAAHAGAGFFAPRPDEPSGPIESSPARQGAEELFCRPPKSGD